MYRIFSMENKALGLGFHKNSFRGWMEFNGGDFDFDLTAALTPEKWNRICLLIDGISGTFEVYFNSIKVKNEMYPFLGGTKEVNGTIVIGSSKDSKFYGEITDLNIWSNFSSENIKEYQECNNVTNNGYIFNWDKNNWKTELPLLKEKHGLCLSNYTVYNHSFNTKRTFDEGFKLCENLGGIPYQHWKENETINTKHIEDSCPWFWMPVRFFDNKLISNRNQETILESDIHWSFGSPKESKKRPCLYMDNSKRTIGNTRCDSEACHICQLKTPINFKLDGLCKNSIIDHEFYIWYDFSTMDLNWSGFGGSAIIMNRITRQWEIVDQLNPGVVLGRTLLEAPESENYPLGKNAWEILNDTCVGPNQKITLNLKFSHCTKVSNVHILIIKLST